MEREFYGFRSVTETKPCVGSETACPYIVTDYRQDAASAGLVEAVRHYDGAGALLRQRSEIYTVNATTPPFTALNTHSSQYTYDGAAFKRSAIARAFDAYRNVIRELHYGDYNVAGDERRVFRVFAPNTTDYIVSLPRYQQTFKTASAVAANRLELTYFYYDNAASHLDPPVRGDVTKVLRWKGDGAGYADSRTEYDAFGNVTASIDAVSNRSEFDYDPAPSPFKRSAIARAFDAYRNVIRELHYGDYNVAGDERRVFRVFAPNTTDYIVSLMTAAARARRRPMPMPAGFMTGWSGNFTVSAR